jgi:hypothetical protein
LPLKASNAEKNHIRYGNGRQGFIHIDGRKRRADKILIILRGNGAAGSDRTKTIEGLKLLDENFEKSEHPRNVPDYPIIKILTAPQILA